MTKPKREKKKPFQYIPDLTAIERHKIARHDTLNYQVDIDRLKPKTAAPIYVDQDELLKAFLNYINYCITMERIPNPAGFCVYDQITQETLSSYLKRPEFKEVADYIGSLLQDTYIHTYPEKAADYLTYKLQMAAPKKAEADHKTNILIYNTMRPEELEIELERIKKERQALEAAAQIE